MRDKVEFNFSEALYEFNDYIGLTNYIRKLMGKSEITQESIDLAFEELSVYFYDNEFIYKPQLLEIIKLLK